MILQLKDCFSLAEHHVHSQYPERFRLSSLLSPLSARVTC